MDGTLQNEDDNAQDLMEKLTQKAFTAREIKQVKEDGKFCALQLQSIKNLCTPGDDTQVPCENSDLGIRDDVPRQKTSFDMIRFEGRNCNIQEIAANLGTAELPRNTNANKATSRKRRRNGSFVAPNLEARRYVDGRGLSESQQVVRKRRGKRMRKPPDSNPVLLPIGAATCYHHLLDFI